MSVVVGDELGQDLLEPATVEVEHSVEALAAHGAGEPLGQDEAEIAGLLGDGSNPLESLQMNRYRVPERAARSRIDAQLHAHLSRAPIRRGGPASSDRPAHAVPAPPGPAGPAMDDTGPVARHPAVPR